MKAFLGPIGVDVPPLAITQKDALKLVTDKYSEKLRPSTIGPCIPAGIKSA
jgi:hypothetical protein